MATQSDVILVRTLIADPASVNDIIIVDALPPTGEPKTGYTITEASGNYDGQVYTFADGVWSKATLITGDSRIRMLIDKVGVWKAAKFLLLQQIEMLSTLGGSSSEETGGLASASLGSLSVSFNTSASADATTKISLWKEKLAALDQMIALLGGGEEVGNFLSFCRVPVGGVLEEDILAPRFCRGRY